MSMCIVVEEGHIGFPHKFHRKNYKIVADILRNRLRRKSFHQSQHDLPRKPKVYFEEWFDPLINVMERVNFRLFFYSRFILVKG